MYVCRYSQPPGMNSAMGSMAASLFQGGGVDPLGGAMGMAAAQFGEQQINEVHGRVSGHCIAPFSAPHTSTITLLMATIGAATCVV